MSSIINKSKFIVTVKRRPDLTRGFPHYKGVQAEAYKQELLNEDRLVAEIERGPFKLLVRIRTPGWPAESQRVHSYSVAEDYEAQTRADHIRGVRVSYKLAREKSTAELIQRYIDEECG